jgi:hypothetical protein
LWIVLTLIVLAFAYKKRHRLLPQILIILIITDLFFFARGNIFTTNRHNLQIPAFDFGLDRYLSLSDTAAYLGIPVYWNHLRVRQPFAPDLSSQELIDFSQLKTELAAFPADLNLLSPPQFNLSGYSAVVLNSFARYFSSDSINSIKIDNILDSRVTGLGVNYYISNYPKDYLATTPGLKLINDNPRIYQTADYHPRAFYQQNQNLPQIISYQPNRIVINTNTASDDQLVLTDSYYPGWTATIDQQPVEITPYHQAFRQIRLPAGQHTVEFIYRPVSFYTGAIISLIFAIFIILIFIPAPIKQKLPLNKISKFLHYN